MRGLRVRDRRGDRAWLCAAVFALAPGPRQDGDRRPTYLEVARAYAGGARAAAVADLGRFSLKELSAELDAVRARVLAPPCRGCPAPEDPPPLRAIAMLHTDRDDLESAPTELTGERRPNCGIRPQAELAARAVALLQSDEAGREFSRRFHVALALRGLHQGCVADAQDWAKAGLKSFPRDPNLLYAIGLAHEVTAASVGPPPPLLGPAPPSVREAAFNVVKARRIALEDARHAYEQVLAADPTREEARLHLGRALLQLERRTDARQKLEELLGRTPTNEVRYLAHLFLGRVHEDEGRLDAAEEQYARAFALDPAQSAAVALSHVLVGKGEPEEARTVLDGALREARGRTQPDLFWVYTFGAGDLAVGMLEELREEASR